TAVRRDSYGAYFGIANLPGRFLTAGSDLPNLYGAIRASRNKFGAVTGEDDGIDPRLMPSKRRSQSAAGGVPEFHRGVQAGAGQQLAIRTEGDAHHGSPMSLEGETQLGRSGIPK